MSDARTHLRRCATHPLMKKPTSAMDTQSRYDTTHPLFHTGLKVFISAGHSRDGVTYSLFEAFLSVRVCNRHVASPTVCCTTMKRPSLKVCTRGGAAIPLTYCWTMAIQSSVAVAQWRLHATYNLLRVEMAIVSTGCVMYTAILEYFLLCEL